MDLDNDPKLLANFLTPAELELISPEIQKKLQKYVNKILDEYCEYKVAVHRMGKSFFSNIFFIEVCVCLSMELGLQLNDADLSE